MRDTVHSRNLASMAHTIAGSRAIRRATIASPPYKLHTWFPRRCVPAVGKKKAGDLAVPRPVRGIVAVTRARATRASNRATVRSRASVAESAHAAEVHDQPAGTRFRDQAHAARDDDEADRQLIEPSRPNRSLHRTGSRLVAAMRDPSTFGTHPLRNFALPNIPHAAMQHKIATRFSRNERLIDHIPVRIFSALDTVWKGASCPINGSMAGSQRRAKRRSLT